MYNIITTIITFIIFFITICTSYLLRLTGIGILVESLKQDLINEREKASRLQQELKDVSAELDDLYDELEEDGYFERVDGADKKGREERDEKRGRDEDAKDRVEVGDGSSVKALTRRYG